MMGTNQSPFSLTMASFVDKDEEDGGYDLNFVDNIHDDFTCAICLLVLKDPYQIVPCGHRFCRNCLLKIIRQTKDPQCPNDREPISEDKMFPDMHCRRTVLNLKVRCYNSDKGCDWCGEVSSYKHHCLQCTYREVPCTNEGCKMIVVCKDLQQHIENTCHWRLRSCEFCFVWIPLCEFQQHEMSCDMVPHPCPNSCGFMESRKKLTEHIKNQCLHSIIECPLHFLGCKFQASRDSVGIHMQDVAGHHIHLLCDEVKQLRAKLTDAKQPENTVTFIWRCDHFQECLIKARTGGHPVVISEPFKTGPRGYILHLSLYPNGSYDAIGDHASLYIHIGPDKYDSILPWPFQLCFTMAIIDQTDCDMADRDHVQIDYSPNQDINEFQKDCFKRPIHTPNNGWGSPRFISHPKLFNGKYIKDNCLMILVKMQAFNAEDGLGI